MSLNKTLQSIKILISIIVMFIAGLLIIYSLSLTAEIKENVLNYINSADLNYKVYNFNNSVIEDKTNYQASNINNLQIIYDYNFIATNKYDISYEYEIIKEILIIDNEEAIYKNQEILETKTIKESNTNGYKIKELININFQEAKNEYIMNNQSLTSKAYLNIYFNTSSEGVIDGYEVPVTNKASIKIPLNNEEIIIEKIIDNENKDIEKTILAQTSNYEALIVGIILLLIPTIILILDYKKIHKIHKHQITYKKELESILTKYSKKVIHTNKMPRIKSKKIIEINSLNELLKLEKNLKKGILVYEKHKYKETWFMIINNKEVMIYKQTIDNSM